MQDALDALAELGGRSAAHDDVVYEGRQIVLPAEMDVGAAVSFLREKQVEDENEVYFSRTFRYGPWDGARATFRALTRAFGTVRQHGSAGEVVGPICEGPKGAKPPQLLTIPVSATETEQVPWGGLGLTAMPGIELTLDRVRDPDHGLVFRLWTEAPRRYRYHMEGIFQLVEAELATSSMYRGKAFDGQDVPQFLDLSAVDATKVVYTEAVLARLEAELWSLLRYPTRMRDLGLPLKRTVVLEGPYGTGKTLAGFLTAQIAEQHGWTFIYGRPGRDDLENLLATARLYEPAVVFFEDVDSLADAGTVDDPARLLDALDGIQSKGTEVICVLTTNHIHRLHKGVMRPGRVDAIIHVGALDPPAIDRLIQTLVPAGQLDPSLDWGQVGAAMDGFMPAFCKEAIDRAMRRNLARNGGVMSSLTTEDFVRAADGLRPQLELMNRAGEGARPENLTGAIEQAVREALDDTRLLVAGDADAPWAALVAPDAGPQPDH